MPCGYPPPSLGGLGHCFKRRLPRRLASKSRDDLAKDLRVPQDRVGSGLEAHGGSALRTARSARESLEQVGPLLEAAQRDPEGGLHRLTLRGGEALAREGVAHLALEAQHASILVLPKGAPALGTRDRRQDSGTRISVTSVLVIGRVVGRTHGLDLRVEQITDERGHFGNRDAVIRYTVRQRAFRHARI